MPYIPHTEEEVREMLDRIGVADTAALFDDIPASMRPEHFDLPKGLSEMQVLTEMERLAAKNKTETVSFLGAGFYDHYIPAAVDAISSRGEFYTAYTPYQPEASQGTLQAIFEYQTAVARLMDLDCANASVYDGGTAIFEAVMMAVRQTRRRKVLVSEGRFLVCPFHGASFEIASGACVGGPAGRSALTRVPVEVRGGEVVAA
jgi:glycine dehydrogenase subunit 1